MRLGDPLSAQARKAGHGGLAKRVTEKKAWLWRSSRAEWHLRYGLVPECHGRWRAGETVQHPPSWLKVTSLESGW